MNIPEEMKRLLKIDTFKGHITVITRMCIKWKIYNCVCVVNRLKRTILAMNGIFLRGMVKTFSERQSNGGFLLITAIKLNGKM